MNTNGGGWRRAVELVAGTLAALWVLVLVMAVASGAPYEAGQRTGQLLVWLVIFLVARQSRIKKQRSDASAVPYGAAHQGGQAPPGWYSDPAGAGHRYWNGTAWTEHRS